MFLDAFTLYLYSYTGTQAADELSCQTIDRLRNEIIDSSLYPGDEIIDSSLNPGNETRGIPTAAGTCDLIWHWTLIGKYMFVTLCNTFGLYMRVQYSGFLSWEKTL